MLSRLRVYAESKRGGIEKGTSSLSLFSTASSCDNIAHALKGERHNAEIYCFNLFLWGVTLKILMVQLVLLCLFLLFVGNGTGLPPISRCVWNAQQHREAL
jgi:hypothetical protein